MQCALMSIAAGYGPPDGNALMHVLQLHLFLRGLSLLHESRRWHARGHEIQGGAHALAICTATLYSDRYDRCTLGLPHTWYSGQTTGLPHATPHVGDSEGTTFTSASGIVTTVVQEAAFIACASALHGARRRCPPAGLPSG